MSAAQTNIEALLFTQQQLYWRDKAKKFAASISTEEIIAADKKNEFRRDRFEAACKEGFGGLPFDTTYGGAGGDYVSLCLVNEELAKRCCPIMSCLGVHILCQGPIYTFGSQEQKQKYLPPSSTGKYLAAFALTEPNAGSDTASIQATARKTSDGFILNGSKVFITGGANANYFIVMAKVEDKNSNLTGSKSITSFIVEKNFPGFQIGQKFKLLGMRGQDTCELVFEDCMIPAENLLGQIGSGRKVALSSLSKGRVTIAAQATGWAQGTIDIVVDHLRRSHEKIRNDFCGLLGDLITKIEGARVLTYQAAHSIDRGEPSVMLASAAKLQATDIAMKTATEAISIVGSEAGNSQMLLEHIFRDAKAGQIYEGTNQIQRSLLAELLLA